MTVTNPPIDSTDRDEGEQFTDRFDVLRRLRRLAARAGARPRFIAASATVGNPESFAEQLVGEAVDRLHGIAESLLLVGEFAPEPFGPEEVPEEV